MGENQDKYSNWQFVRDFAHFFRKKKKQFIFFTITLSIAFGLGLIPPIITAKIIDFFVSDSVKEISTFNNYILILLGVMATATTLRLVSKHYLDLLTQEVKRDTRVESFEKLMEGDLMWHDKENTGNKMEKITEGVNSISRFMNIYTNQLLSSVVALIGIISVFTFFNPKYALLTGVYMITYLFIELKLNKRLAEATKKVRAEKEESSGKAYEFSSNINTIKSLGIENSSNQEITKQEDLVLATERRRKTLSTQKWISVQLVSTLFFVIFIFLVGKDILAGLLTAGSIVIYMIYLSRLQNVLAVVSSQSERLIEIKYSVQRLIEIYKNIPSINEDHASALKQWNRIKLANVSFKYKNEGVLDKFNLIIKKGEKIGLVGRSGSGKSTLFKLLLKLYLPQVGMIYFDNKPISELKRDSIIHKYSIVPQETEVFNVSLKDNILFSNPKKYNKELYDQSLQISMMNQVIKKLKEGDNALIGEKGVRLSGGERQRLGIARAIYRNSDIIIMDESTSNLDYETERKIQDQINKKLKGKTLIISAHRLTTLAGMDRIIVMKKGRVVEEGKYDELIRRRGEFYKIWKKQGGKED